MIVFETENYEVYCKIFAGFFDAFLDDCKYDDLVDEIAPIYLRREQFKKCKKALIELHEWCKDNFIHQMKGIHEILLYYFLELVEEHLKDEASLKTNFFSEDVKILIKEAAKADFEEYLISDPSLETTIEEFEENFYNIQTYYDTIYEDLDFLNIDFLYNDQVYLDGELVKRLGGHLDFYWDILPEDIQKQFSSENITLTGDVFDFINYIQKQLSVSDMAELFWENGTPVKENKIQLVLKHILDAYFIKSGIYIGREAMLGKNKIDFLLYKNDNIDEKVLIEIKKASSRHLVKGYEKQLQDYIKTSGFENAFYIIACFTNEEVELAETFIAENIYTNQFQLYINIVIFDFRIKKAASK